MADGKVTIKIDGDNSGFKSAMNGIESIAKSSISGINNLTSSIATGLLGAVTTVSGAMATLVGYSTKVGKDFEAQMSTVNALSGATADEMAILTDKAKELGVSSVFSATEAGKAFEYMALAGWNTEQMLDGVNGIMAVASASGEDLGLVADIVTDSLTAFGQSASESGRLADVLASASSASNTSIAQLGETFQYVAPVAGALGFSMEDVAIASGLMANAGIKASSSGTALRSIMTNMIKPTSNMEKAMKELGLSATYLDGTMKPLDVIMGDLRDSFGNLDEAQKAEYASTIAGKEAMSGLLAIVNASESDFNALTESIYNSAGSAQTMSDIKLDNLQGQITLLQSATEGLGIAFFNTFENIAKESVVNLNTVVQDMANAISNGDFTLFAQVLGNGISTVLLDIISYIPSLATVSVTIIQSLIESLLSNKNDLMDGFTQTLYALVDGFSEILPTLLELVATITPLIAETLVLGYPLLLEIGVGLITAIVQGLANNPELLVTNLTIFIESIVSIITENLPILLEAGIVIVGAIAQAIIDNIPLITESLFLILEEFTNIFLTELPATIVPLVTSLNELSPLLVTVLTGIMAFKTISTVTSIITALSTAFTTIKSVVTLVSTVFGVMGTAGGTLGTILTALTGPVGLIVAGISALIAIGTAVILNWEEVGAFFTKLWDDISKFTESFLNGMSEFFSNAWDNITEITSQLAENILKFLSDSWENVKNATQTFLNFLSDLFTESWNTIKETVSSVYEWFQSATSDLWETIKNTVSTAIDFVINYYTVLLPDAVKFMWDFVSNIFTDFLQGVVDLGQDIISTLTNIDWLSLGNDMVKGIMNGFLNMGDFIYQTVTKFGNSVKDKIKGFFGIHSPSKVMQDEVGVMLGYGVGIGITDSQDEVNKSVDKFSQGIMDTFSDNIKLSGEEASISYKKASQEINSMRKLNTYSMYDELDAWENIYSQMAQGTLERAEAEAEYYKTSYAISETWIKNKKAINDLSAKQEMETWQQVYDSMLEGTQEKIKSEQNLYKAKQTFLKSDYEYFENWVNNKKELNALSLTEELQVWEYVQSRYEEGTQQRIDAEQNYFNVKKEIQEEINALEENYNKEYQNRYSEIMNMYSLFEEVAEKEAVESADLVNNLRDQVAELTEWGMLLDNLAQRGVAGELFDEIKSLGVGAMAELRALVSMTDNELDDYAKQYEAKQMLANRYAEKELQNLRQDTDNQIKQLVQGVEDKFAYLPQITQDSTSQMVSSAEIQLNNLKNSFSNTAQSIVSDFNNTMSQLQVAPITYSANNVTPLQATSQAISTFSGNDGLSAINSGVVSSNSTGYTTTTNNSSDNSNKTNNININIDYKTSENTDIDIDKLSKKLGEKTSEELRKRGA